MLGTKEKISEKHLSETDLMHENEIILYNDDVNTFDQVINTLIIFCDNTLDHAKHLSL